ncbi:hypothetical protein OPQ81_000661 [Rhizoctonia solani]|nr:hypothetical protein OPQ81_000661 [Rhizoctonia solani]
MNLTNLPTCYTNINTHSNSIIDLTILNSCAVDTFQDFEWEVETPGSGKSLGSDHMAITWHILAYLETTPSPETPLPIEFIIDPSQEEEWTSIYYDTIAKSINLDNPTPYSPKDIDNIAGIILLAMNEATEQTMPKNPNTNKIQPSQPKNRTGGTTIAPRP